MTELPANTLDTASNKLTTDFDYIISGAGCAGISLLVRILKEPQLQNKTILIIDSDLKQSNDHTWCFWEQGIGFLEHLVYHIWEKLNFYSDKDKLQLNIAPFSYKMIRSIDFYNYAKNLTYKRSKIHWKQASIIEIGNVEDYSYVVAGGTRYTAKYVFNSLLINEDKASFKANNCYKLLQHFKGWVIETKEPLFNPLEATFMDFRVGQELGATFVYVLPTTSTRALIEYTFFNDNVLTTKEYDSLLKNYLEKYCKLTSDDYTISETEIGVIPMTNHQFRSHQGNVINIGTAGGWTKATSGFTFQFIQKYTAEIVTLLIAEKPPIVEKGFNKAKFNLYDSTLLNVLINKKMEAKDIFFQLFSKQKPQTILRFLDNDTTLKEDINILMSVPTAIFLPAAIHELFSRPHKK